MLSRRPLAAFVAVLALVTTTLVAPATGAGNQEPANEGEARQQYDEVLADEAQLLDDHQALGIRRLVLRDELASVDAQLAEVTTRLADAQVAFDAAEAQALQSEADHAAAVRELLRATEELHQRAVSSYINGGDGAGIELLLEEAHSNRSGRLQEYSQAVVGSQQEVVDDFVGAREAAETTLADAKAARDHARAQRDEVAALAASVEQVRADQAAAITETDELAFLQGVVLGELKGRKAVVEARIFSFAVESDGLAALLAAHQAGQPDWFAGAVPFFAPLQQPRVSSEFGMRSHPILGTSRLHAGMDFSVPTGTPILSAAPGTVLLAGPRGGYGNTVVIDHGHSLATLYAHQSAIAVAPGDVVEAGQVIGSVGSTGLSTGPHLHFETRLRGQPTNPRNFFSP